MTQEGGVSGVCPPSLPRTCQKSFRGDRHGACCIMSADVSLWGGLTVLLMKNLIFWFLTSEPEYVTTNEVGFKWDNLARVAALCLQETLK